MTSVVEYDLHEWLPGWGENKITTRSENGDFIVSVTYDGPDGVEKMKSLVFRSTCFYSVGSFPGVGAMGYKHDYEFSTGKILKITDSEFMAKWNEYWQAAWPNVKRECNHFMLFFGSENKVIHVVASEVMIH